MPLWTPYADDSALDLRVKSKSERTSPRPNTEVQYPSRYTVPGVNYPAYTGYPSMVYVPVAGPSPVSSSSGYTPNPIDVDSLSGDSDFQAFERDAIRVMVEKNGGTLLGNNPRMRRAVQTSQNADDSYRKHREKNNFAAKQSRDRRKLREIHLALKVRYLKSELTKLKSVLASTVCTRCRDPCLC